MSFGVNHGAPNHAELLPPSANFYIPRGLTGWHLPHVRHFHIYGSLMDVKFKLPDLLWPWRQKNEHRSSIGQPRRLTVTIPYTGWPGWHAGEEPALDGLGSDGLFPGSWPDTIEEICLRLETMEVFPEAMDEIV